MAALLKSAELQDSVGSNPTLSATSGPVRFERLTTASEPAHTPRHITNNGL